MRATRSLALLLAVSALCACSSGIASNNDVPESQAQAFHAGLTFFPTGKKMYWLGPAASGFILRYALHPADDASGATLGYACGHLYIMATTFLGAKTPPADRVYPSDGILVGTALTSTGQRVGFKILKNARPPSPQVIAKLIASIRPVTNADIDRLPDDWIKIR
jgi:hypothetical protein